MQDYRKMFIKIIEIEYKNKAKLIIKIIGIDKYALISENAFIYFPYIAIPFSTSG